MFYFILLPLSFRVPTIFRKGKNNDDDVPTLPPNLLKEEPLSHKLGGGFPFRESEGCESDVVVRKLLSIGVDAKI